MAESAIGEDKYLNSCPICQETYKTKRTLSCLHTFCETCLSSYITSCLKDNKNPPEFACPVCRTDIALPSAVDIDKWVSDLEFTEPHATNTLKLSDKFCEICNRKNEKINAVSWCFECQEAICEGCVRSHQVIKSLEHHQIKSLDKFKKEQVAHIPTVDTYCQKHKDRKLEIYCHDHKAICCQTCMTTNHRKCDKVTTIDEAAQEIKQSAEDEKIAERINVLSVQMRECADRCYKNMEDLTNQKKDTETSISDKQREIIFHFEELGKKARNELETMHKETLQILQERLAQYEKCAKTLEQCRASVGYIPKHFTDLQTCIELDRIKRYLTEQEQYMTSEADRVQETFKYKFSISPVIENMTSTMTMFGDILRCSEKGSGIVGEPILVNTFKVDSLNIIFISDGYFLCDRRILINCYSKSSEIRIYDVSGTIQIVNKFELMPTYSFGCSFINDTLYVTSRYNGSSVIFIDAASQRVVKKTQVQNLKARRLVWSGNKIIVASVQDVKILDQDGNLSKTLASSSGEIFGVCVTKDNNILYTDIKLDTLHCINTNGQMLFDYKDGSLLCPTDVKTDSDGNIYVVGRMSHNIHLLTPDGKFKKMFLSETDGIHRPFFLSFNNDVSTSKCMVCCDMDDHFSHHGGLYIKLYNMI